MKKFTLFFSAMLIGIMNFTNAFAANNQLSNADYDVTSLEMSNLKVQSNDGYEALEASDELSGITVLLGVYPDGHLHEGSTIDWSGTELPILEGSIIKSYDEELETDIYKGIVVVEFFGGKLGLDLTMYAKKVKSVKINIVEATAEVIEKIGVLRFTAEWEGYPVIVSIAGYEETDKKEYNGSQISEIQIGNFDNWYDFAMADNVVVYKNGDDFTVKGLYTSLATETPYDVTLTTKSSYETETRVNNVGNTIAPTKMIKNGQIIIQSNGLYYNILGSTIKK